MLGLLFFIHLKKRARTVCFDNQFNHYIYIFDVNKVDIRKRSECIQSVFDKRFSSQIYIFSTGSFIKKLHALNSPHRKRRLLSQMKNIFEIKAQ